jgi:hypothetical protein
MRADAGFWQHSAQEWGRGAGYRGRINDHNREWFREGRHGEADALVAELVREEWRQTVGSMRELLVQEWPVKASMGHSG